MTTHAKYANSIDPAYPVPLNEYKRLRTLQSLGLLDTPAENALDSVARQAASICKTPIALISLVDSDRQWFKARIGLDIQETPRCTSFCAHTILNTQLFEVMDARADPRFAEGPLVTGKTDIRFYAGMPLLTSDGLALGTLCVMDHERRVLSSKQRESLRDLATMVAALLESRKEAAAAVQLSLILHEAFDEIIVLHPGSHQIQFANERAVANLGYDSNDLHQMSLPLMGTDYPLNKLQKLCSDAVHGDRAPLHFQAINIRKDGSTYPVEVRAAVSSTGATSQVLLLVNDISERKMNEEQLGDLVAYDSVTKLANRGNLEVR
ncbi:MAG: GAF domain-containing protein, partial [Betaproteobacteria bacterium]